MPTYAPNRCHHIKMNGTQCGSPAMRTQRFCFFHLSAAGPLNCEIKSYDLRPDENFLLPVLEDATSIQLAISQVMAFLIRDYIDVKKARVLLSACKLASQNLKRMDTEKPRPTQMLVDVKTIPTTPMGADNLWSATAESPDRSEDPGLEPDVEPDLEPNDEPAAPQAQNAPPTAFQTQSLNQHEAARYGRKDRRRISEATKREERKAALAHLDEARKRAKEEARNQPQAGKSTGALPPGTIQACQEIRGRRSRKEYVI